MKRLDLGRTGFFKFVLLLATASSWIAPFQAKGETVFWPPIATDAEKVKYLLRVHDEMPDLFPAMVDFGTDYMTVLEMQDRLNRKLGRDPDFKKLLSERPDRLVIDVNVTPAAGQEPAATRPEIPGLQLYATELRLNLTSLPQTGTLQESLKSAIAAELKIFPGVSLKKYNTALITALPVDRRAVFPMPFADKLQYLRDTFGETLGSKIDHASFDLSFRDLSAQEHLGQGSHAVEVFEKLVHRDLRLAELLNLAVLAKKGAHSLTFEDLGKRIDHLDYDEAVALGSSAELQARVQAFLQDATPGPQIPNHSISEVVSQLKDYLEKPIKAFSQLAQDAAGAEKPLATYRLVEEPVQLAVVGGGCWGRDCNTKNLAAYNNSPYIKAFSVDRAHGKSARGRADVGLVSYQNEIYLFINTINGVSLDGQAAQDIVQAFYQARAKFGAAGVILAKSEDLDHNINFDVIRDGLRKLVENQPVIKFGYPDAALRRKLGTYAQQTIYHDPDKVFEGVLYRPETMADHSRTLELKVDLPKPFEAGDLPLNKPQVLALALELDATGNRALADRFAKVAHLSETAWKSLRSKIRNEDLLPVDAYFNSAKDALHAVGIQFDSRFKTLKLEAYMPGLIRAPDAFSGDWKDRSISATLTLIKKGVDREGVAQALKNNKELFISNESLKKWLEKTVEFDGPTADGPAFHTAEMLGDAGIDVASFPEAEAKLRLALDGDEYHRLAAAGTLYRFRKFEGENLLKMLLKAVIGIDGTDDLNEPTFIEQFQELKRRDPAAYATTLIKDLKSRSPKTQRAALHALNFTELRERILPALESPELMEILRKMRFEGAALPIEVSDYGSWMHEQLEWKRSHKPPVQPTFNIPGPVQVLSRAPGRSVAVVTAEVDGIFNTGGLGQAVLKYAQASNGKRGASRVTLIMPYYTEDNDLTAEDQTRIVETGRIIEVAVDFDSQGNARANEKFSVLSFQKGNTPVFMLRHEPKDGHPNLFHNPRGTKRLYGDPSTLGVAFAVFDKAAAQLTITEKFNVVSAADWHAGWTNMLLQQSEKHGITTPKRMLWLHNALYKGDEYNTHDMYRYLGLDPAEYHQAQGAEYFGKVSPLKGSAYAANLTLTVSSSYAAELATPRFGYGLEQTMRDLLDTGRLTGVLNGIDNEEWTPRDFSTQNMAGKKAAKAAAQTHFGLHVSPTTPLIVMTSRITRQKGFDYALEALRDFLTRENAQVLIVGDSDQEYVEPINSLMQEPAIRGKLVRVSFSREAEAIALRGGDGFLLPSEVEPSGLNQLYALRNGTVPIVTDVGGLRESVQEGRNGFVAHVITERDGKTINKVLTRDSLIETMERFVDTYQHSPAQFSGIQKAGMTDDNSWNQRVSEYEAAYDYMESGTQTSLADGSLHGALAGLKPSQLMMVARKVWVGSNACIGRSLDKALQTVAH